MPTSVRSWFRDLVARPLVVLVTGVLLVASILVGGSAVGEESKASSQRKNALVKATDSNGDDVLDAPDPASAAAGAVAEDEPVEDLSERSGTSTVVINPDGTRTLRQYQNPVRVKRGEEWLDVDPTLEMQPDGTYRPKVSATDIVIGGGDSKEAGKVTFENGRSVAVTWPETLPEPTIRGGTATYKLSDTTDLLMIVAGDGVSARIRLNERPAEDDAVFTFGLRTDELTLDKDSDGGLSLKDEQGTIVGGTANLVAWDARTDDAGEPLQKVALESDLDQTGRSGDLRMHELDLTAPDGFLSDPATEFPVTIDPDIRALGAARDTWTRQNETAVHGSDSDLRVGKLGGSSNTNPSVSYMQWSLSDRIPSGSTIVSATMELHQFFAGSCGPTSMVLQPLSSDWGADMVWSTRPSSLSTDYVYVSENKGFQCTGANAAGRISIPATTWVTNWWNGAYPNYGLRLGVPAANETQSSYERRFCSYNSSSADGNCPNAANEPSMVVTYNQPPNTPTNLDVTFGGNPATVYARVSDPNAETTLKALLKVSSAGSSTTYHEMYTNTVNVGPDNSGAVSATLPYLPDGSWQVTATAVDDNGATSSPSSAVSFEVDTEFGMQSWYSTTQHQLNDRSGLAVNNRTGNLVVKADDISVNGLGLDFNATRFYNSQSSRGWAGAMGKRWTLSIGPDVWLQNRSALAAFGDDTHFDYHGPGRTRFGSYSKPLFGSNWSKPSGGVGADLTKSGSGASTVYTLKFRKSQLRYEFKKFGSGGHAFQTKIRDRSGNEINFAYSGTDSAGRPKLSTITDSSGRSYTVTYTGDYISSIVENAGAASRTYSYGYDAEGYLTTFTAPTDTGAAPLVTNYSYTAATSMSGKVLTKIEGPVGPSESASTRTTTSFGYHGVGANVDRVYHVKYRKDASTTADFEWTYARRTTDQTCNEDSKYSTNVHDARAKTTSYCFRDASGSDKTRIRVKDAEGNLKTSTYTADKAASNITTPFNAASAGGSTVANYSPTLSDQLTSVTEPKTAEDGTSEGAKSLFSYANPTTRAGGNYLPTSVGKDNKQCSVYEYDSEGRTTAAYTGLTFNGTDASNCTKGSGAVGAHRRYNSNGTLNESWEANVDVSDPNGPGPEKKTIYTYWSAGETGGSPGQVKTIRKPGGSCDAPRKLCTSYMYDGFGRVTTATDGRGKETRYVYDLMDRVTETYFNGATTCNGTNTNCVKYTYDADGNLTSRVDRAGTSTFVYDRLNRQTRQNLPGAVIDLAYDDNGNLISHTQTLTGQPAQTVTYSYDDANRPVTAHSNGIGTGTAGDIGFSPDPDGRVKQIQFPATGGLLMNYDYRNSGKPKRTNVKETGGDPKRELDYSYVQDLDPGPGEFNVETNQLQSRTVTAEGTGNNSLTEYTYDGEQLESSSDDNGPDYAYTHDKSGNIRSEASEGTTTYFGYDYAGQLCWRGQADGSNNEQTCGAGPSGSTNFSHDAAGNNTNFASNPTVYNDDSQVTTIDGVIMGYMDRGNDLRTTAGGVSYVNSPLGVTAKKEGADITYYVRDPNGSILASYGADGTRFYFSEFNGSVVALYDAAGDEVGTYEYSPYGKTTAAGTSAENNPFRYIGGLQDKDSAGGDSYYKLGARYYDAQGHFTQPDPIVAGGGGFNYTAGDPVNASDPSGLLTINFGVTACAVLCLGADFSYDLSSGEGAVGGNFGYGVGLQTNILGHGTSLSGSGLEGGFSGPNTSCSAGPLGLTQGPSGGIPSTSLNFSKSLSVACSQTMSYTKTFG